MCVVESHDEGVMRWMAHLQAEGLSVQSALQYTNNLVAALRRLAGIHLEHSSILRDFRRALKRRGALKPQKHAVPATREEAKEAMQREPRDVVKIALSLTWAGAARSSDVLRLDRDDVKPMGNGQVAVRWTQSKSDPYRVGRMTGLRMPRRYYELLTEHLRTTARPREKKVFPQTVTYASIAAAVKRVKLTLTPHSLRRGALTHLARLGLPLEEIRLLSRHSTIEGVVRYIDAAENIRITETEAVSSRLAW